MNAETFRYEQDPGHGWVEVPRFMLEKLGIDGLITQYSYQRGNLVYLEEDMDLGTFLTAYREHYGQDPVLESVHVNATPIRRYAVYSKWATA